MQSWLMWIAGALCLVVSFFVTLRLIEPVKPPNQAVALLQRASVSDRRTLMAAVKAAGLAGSPNVKGEIDKIERLDRDRVVVRGWVAEVGHAGVPLQVIIFADGRQALTMTATGGHSGVVQTLGISDAAKADNVSFHGTFECGRGETVFVIAVSDRGAYGYFGPLACP